MALSLNNIEINCSEGLQVAKELRQAADELQRELGNYQGVAAGLQASWTGLNANKFAGKMAEMESKISGQVAALTNLAAAIEQTVAIYRKEQTSLYYQEQAAKKKAAESGGGEGHSF